MQQYDVIVVGKGNAALCAALAARDKGVSVAILEAAPEEESGGNSRFAGGVMRFAYDGVKDLQKLTDIPPEEVDTVDWESNTIDEFYDDLYRVTNFRTDPNLSETLITKSLDTMVWVRSQGARFLPNYRFQSGMVNGKRKFFGRMPLWMAGGGPGLVEALANTAVVSPPGFPGCTRKHCGCGSGAMPLLGRSAAMVGSACSRPRMSRGSSTSSNWLISDIPSA